MEDGKLINVQEFLSNFAEDDKFLSDKIAEFQKQERSAFAIVKHVERTALLRTLDNSTRSKSIRCWW
jgi:ABC-type iron transport system FetAB ATPase subunit